MDVAFLVPRSPLILGLESLAVAGFCLTLGWLIADALLGRRGRHAVYAWGLSVGTLSLYVLTLMVLHMATGGGVLSEPWLVRAVTGVAFFALAIRKVVQTIRDRGAGTDRAARAGLMVIVLLATVVWGAPVFRMLPLFAPGDMTFHTGYAEQLMNGEATPTSFITGNVPNSYPWFFHASLAFIADLTPGGHALHALSPMQMLQVWGAVLALYAFGYALTEKWTTGLMAALFGALTGGFGFFFVDGPDVVLNPRGPQALKYFGDLLFKRSYNASFYNLAPPFARDLAYDLLLVVLLLLLLGLKAKRTGLLVLAGFVLGTIGLTGAEPFLLGMASAALAVVVPFGMPRAKMVAAIFAPALGLYALWIVPQAMNFLRLGGYVSMAGPPVELPPEAIFVSWGIVTPLAILGAVAWVRRITADPAVRLVFVVALAAVALLIASVVAVPLLGQGFNTLGRAHRYWPLVYLAASLLAALGATAVVDKVGAVHVSLAAVVVALFIGLASASPTLASVALADEFSPSPSSSIRTTAVKGDDRALLNLVSQGRHERCVVAAPLSVDAPLFSYTGYRMVMFAWLAPDGRNPARIRWVDIKRAMSPRRRMNANLILTRGEASPDRWRGIADRYGVDVVVVPGALANERNFRGYRKTSSADSEFTVAKIGSCAS